MIKYPETRLVQRSARFSIPASKQLLLSSVKQQFSIAEVDEVGVPMAT